MEQSKGKDRDSDNLLYKVLVKIVLPLALVMVTTIFTLIIKQDDKIDTLQLDTATKQDLILQTDRLDKNFNSRLTELREDLSESNERNERWFLRIEEQLKENYKSPSFIGKAK